MNLALHIYIKIYYIRILCTDLLSTYLNPYVITYEFKFVCYLRISNTDILHTNLLHMNFTYESKFVCNYLRIFL